MGSLVGGCDLYRDVKDIPGASPVNDKQYAQNTNLVNFQQLANAINAGAALSEPRIVNKDYPAANAIQSIALSANTIKILIKHRDGGKLDFSFDSSLTTFITLPRGGVYSDEGFLLTGKTIYFRSPKVGTIELLEYSFN